ncbi:hypothetical protein [Lutibacter sp.]|uniref:hypothetical protein n=1 Tax=Lutibacter sp. TaxID=1925666 RepID=UPI0025BA77B4|nr:hypothetical protein [Lutibacter sp.]MCF6181238.1 hypothetical protein [Lutibacter sp.]
MKKFKLLFKTIVILTIVFGCSNNSDTSQEEDLAALTLLNNNIEQLISAGTCSENTNCDFIAFGSKACGGPKSYLIYSTSINVELLKEKVAEYNLKEDLYNKKWGIFSDCTVVSPPTSVECINGKCTAIY